MRKWTESKALDCLLEAGAEITGTKYILVRGGLNGLTSCSAMDYIKRLNYKFKMLRPSRPNRNRKAGDNIIGFSDMSQKGLETVKQPRDFVPNKKVWYNIDDKPLKGQLQDRRKITA